ncbi:nitroreductase family protein [Tengunoibacter tsumagoiensis]|uniref:Oxidoreductase n=1 Tax=Tengunoibacter tsumagoiensis TaxID=2014871 RepID=A0A402A3W1_9CHLR|nr:nitroreductase family protein [Tengunoibacter tsumagoiensis]GCE13762.1 oxidoreductase [Tengunoibacter tsumagoiensis]
MTTLNLTPDELLTTTRAVRKRLDFSRPVEMQVIKECLEIALQAPSGSNRQRWHFVIITDAEKRKAISDYYRKGYYEYRDSPSAAGKLFADDAQRSQVQKRVQTSVDYLAEHMHEAPVLFLPCFQGRPDGQPAMNQASPWGSIIPAAWSFMLAARARGLGSVWTTLHLEYEKEVAEIIGLPYQEVTQVALIPVAYTLGTDFKPAPRQPLDSVLHLNSW